jgi:hypothetical protein
MSKPTVREDHIKDRNSVMTQCKHLSVALPKEHFFRRSTIFVRLKTAVNINRIYIPRPYRAVNTLPLGYKNQSVNVVQKNNFRVL